MNVDTPKEAVLLVEGTDELHVITKLLERHRMPAPFEIRPKGGFSELHASIFNELNEPGRRTLGIVADADDQIDQRWQSISDQLTQAGCQVPKDLANDGSVFAGPSETKVGVWLMPDNRDAGELEDFVAAMIPPDDAVWPLARQYIDGIPEEARRFKPGKLTRAYVHAWLSTRERPRPMGTAIAASDLRHDSQHAASLVGWIGRLFGVQGG